MSINKSVPCQVNTVQTEKHLDGHGHTDQKKKKKHEFSWISFTTKQKIITNLISQNKNTQEKNTQWRFVKHFIFSILTKLLLQNI